MIRQIAYFMSSFLDLCITIFYPKMQYSLRPCSKACQLWRIATQWRNICGQYKTLVGGLGRQEDGCTGEVFTDFYLSSHEDKPMTMTFWYEASLIFKRALKSFTSSHFQHIGQSQGLIVVLMLISVQLLMQFQCSFKFTVKFLIVILLSYLHYNIVILLTPKNILA